MAKLVLATLAMVAGAHADGGYYRDGYGAPDGGGYGSGYGDGYGYGGYYPKATWWKPWTWKYKNYNGYGGYDAPSYGSHGPDLERAANMYVGLKETLVNNIYFAMPNPVQSGTRRRNGRNNLRNQYLQSYNAMPGTGIYTCTCGCEVQEASFGCISFFFNSSGFPSFPNRPVQPNQTISAFQAVYQPAGDSYGSYGSYGDKFVATSQLIIRTNGTNSSTNTLQTTTPAHCAGCESTQTIASTSVVYDMPPGPVFPFVQVQKQGRVSCAAPSAVVRACDARCALAAAEGLVATNEFGAKCVAAGGAQG